MPKTKVAAPSSGTAPVAPVAPVAPQDALQRYRAKRNFAVTPEPAAGDAASAAPGAGEGAAAALSFVIQKHWASRLHYDFRLELDGSMKSWAVPKGPSFDPKDKRMAVHVEDHPIAYSSFEGTIPPKQYGAGKVIIWDKGFWRPVGDAHVGYERGDLKFELFGHKLRGRWVLVRMKGRGEKQEPWLLIKEKDAFVRPAADYSVVDELPDSVAALAAPPAAETGAPAPAQAQTPAQPRASRSAAPPPRDAAPAQAPVIPEGAVAAALPDALKPPLATLGDGMPGDAAEWLCEIKFDGYRMLARIDPDAVRLVTRNANDWTDKLRPLQKELERLALPPGWYDGEIVVLNDRGVPDFGALQRSFDNARTGEVVYYLFDLPYFAGHDLRAVPLQARRALLHGLLAPAASPHVRYSEVFDADPTSVVESACRLGLEGMIAKRRDSAYAAGRTATWIKLKCQRRQEFVIGGFTDPQGERAGIGALLLGVHDAAGALQYVGNVGTGFNEETLGALAAQLGGLRSTARPFAGTERIEGRPHWVRPELVAEVSFGEWTRASRLRHAVFHGLRTDKAARDIVRERAAPPPAVPGAGAAAPAALAPLASRVRVTHGERVIDASTGATKIELVRYYDLVGDLMMAHLKGRPVSLVRAPDGVGGELFFQKHAESMTLPGIRQLDPALYIGHPAMLEVATAQGLLSAAQWNVIELHTLNTGTKSLEHPDRMIFDLDPGDGVLWPQVQEGAQLVHAFLGQLGLPAFLKTSGGKGLHVVVPVRKVHDWDTVRGFSEAIVVHLAKTIPQRFVAKSGPRNRVGKIFIDYLRNGLGATTACAWSARSRPGLGISVPVDWSELGALTGGDQWNIRNVHTRLDRGNTPWAAYAKAAKSLGAAMKMLG